MSAEDDKRLLIRLDERFRILTEKLDEVVEAIDKTREEFRKDYVTQKEFDPVKRAVYAFAGILVTGLIGGLVMLLLGIK
jgi:hypothetical protein